MTQLIDGNLESQRIFVQLKEKIARLESSKKRSPSLAVILVGQNPASEIYVQHKEKACAKVGIHSQVFKLPESSSQADLNHLIQTLNDTVTLDGILIQLPLPKTFDTLDVINRVAPKKDVDGLTIHNKGMLELNLPGFIPCTPLGILKLLENIQFSLKGKIAAVIGRSVLVGAPMAKLLTHHDATVIHLHSKTASPQKLTSMADLIVVAAGVPKLVTAEWIKKGSVVIDVGIHRIQNKLCGDVDFESVKHLPAFITPVPGGVGPMTIAALLSNCVDAYEANNT